jgi:glycosyltransferase involved in cell wall biosynthesis
MRALWIVRRTLEDQLGGDTTQVLRTADALGRLGVEVVMAPAPGPDIESFDVVHLFHLDRLWENLQHCRQLKNATVPTVLTPIFWVSDAFDQRGRSLPQRLLARSLGGGALRNVRLAYQWADQFRRSPRSLAETRPVLDFEKGARRILESIQLMLPASLSEQRKVERLFGADIPSMAVPGAADGEIFHEGAGNGGRDGVLCVGRIEPRKNQLALIRAMQDSGVPLTIVGQAGPTAAAYERRCRREAGEGVRFLDGLSPEDMADLYRSARVHASVSWYETPGLASLEAALCDCAVVATRGGSTAEYLKGDAHYCAPDDLVSIRRAVAGALEDGPSLALRKRVRSEFSWEQAARRTCEAYELVVEAATRDASPAHESRPASLATRR